MKFSPSLVSAALGGLVIVLAFPAPARADPGNATATAKYVDGQGARFESLAGSKENLESLAGGLRSGSRITLIEQTRTGPRATTFVPPTKPMGYGNITRSLDLANRRLAALGITDPTAAQLKAALNGGTVTTARGDVRLDGVLSLRSQGMGWGKIAHTIGVPPSGQAGAQARSHTSPGVVTAAGAGRATASSRSDGPGRSGIVTAANGRPAATPDLARGHGNAFGHASPGVQSGMGPGGNAFGHGRAGK